MRSYFEVFRIPSLFKSKLLSFSFISIWSKAGSILHVFADFNVATKLFTSIELRTRSVSLYVKKSSLCLLKLQKSVFFQQSLQIWTNSSAGLVSILTPFLMKNRLNFESSLASVFGFTRLMRTSRMFLVLGSNMGSSHGSAFIFPSIFYFSTL